MSESVNVPVSTQGHPLRRMLREAGVNRSLSRKATFWTIANKVFDVMPEILIGAAMDTVVRGSKSFIARWFGVTDRWTQLLWLAAVTVVIWVCESITDYLASVAWRNLAQLVQHGLRCDLYTHLQRLDLAWFEDRSSGGLLSVLNDDVNQLERFLDVGAKEIISTAANVVLLGVFFALSSSWLALWAFLPIPLIIVVSLAWQTRLAPRYASVREKVGDLSAALVNNLAGMATITAFTAEDNEARRVAELSEDYVSSNRDAIRYSAAFTPLIRMAILFGFTATLLVGGHQAIQGTLAVGLFSSLVYATQRLLWPLTRLGETVDLYQRAAASTLRILGVREVEPSIVQGPTRLAEPVAGAVRFDAVEFAYSDGVPVLRGLDLDIGAGQTHAIVGTTGAGKSTVLKLLLRQYEATSGAITVDGIDIRELSFPSLRGAIGYVAQDAFLFEGTVRDNLLYGKPGADDAQLRRALDLAEASDFVDALPQGWDTVVGERGQKLSGGQRQRIALARAIVRDPAMLVLDEATSAVDNETEAAIQRSLAVVSADRTTIVVAHRLSTVRHAHCIHVLEAGRVAESGTHEELLAAGGLYAALWRVQTGEGVGAGTGPGSRG